MSWSEKNQERGIRTDFDGTVARDGSDVLASAGVVARDEFPLVDHLGLLSLWLDGIAPCGVAVAGE